MLKRSRPIFLAVVGLALSALLLAAGCCWRGSCESDLRVHQPTVTAGLQPAEVPE